jgi:hypothetical protein
MRNNGPEQDENRPNANKNGTDPHESPDMHKNYPEPIRSL